jgi:DNA (cytosine-5)-methyltransferase 1
MKHFGDVTKLDGSKIPPADIITFGSPCQDVSVSGKRAGINGDKSRLFFEAIRIINEMRCATDGKYPRIACWENVPGATSSNCGHDFRAVLEAFTQTEIPMPRSGKWANAGVVRSGRADIAWRMLNAQRFGLAQRRKRLFLIADFAAADRRAAQIQFID